MDAISDYLECVNFHWMIVVATGMYTHIRQICIIGLCFDDDNIPPFDPSYASVLFIFSVLCLLAEYKLWPRSLKEPPVQLMVIYEMLVAALVTNLATRAIWIPLMHAIWCMTQESSKWLTWLNATLGLDSFSILYSLADYMSKDLAAIHTAFCISVLSFVWMLDATESLDGILDMWTKDNDNTKRTKNTCRDRITFHDPETCFANAMEDWDGDSLLTGPPITSTFFAFGIYVIILKACLFPDTFRKPPIALLSIYEFLATTFILEFCMACVWTPIDIMIMITLPRKMCQIFLNFGTAGIAEWFNGNKILMQILCYGVSLTFLVICLHITRSLDFTILNKCGMSSFVSHIKNSFWNRVMSEILPLGDDRRCFCRSSRKHRRRRGSDSNESGSDNY